MSNMDEFVENCLEAYRRFGPSLVYVITDSEELFNSLSRDMGDTPMALLTSNRDLERELRDKEITVRREKFLPKDILILGSLRHYILRDCFTRTVHDEDRVMCILDTKIRGVFTFDVRDIEFVKLKEEVEDRIDLDLLEHTIDVALDIAFEGREGNHVGALFIIGDPDNVLKNCRDQILNPLQGHPARTRNLHNHECWETIKQFAQLDGAVILADSGEALAAGRYVNMDWGIYLESGYGGRHMAAATISKKTKAIAVVVSETGNIRIFKDGINIFTLRGR